MYNSSSKRATIRCLVLPLVFIDKDVIGHKFKRERTQPDAIPYNHNILIKKIDSNNNNNRLKYRINRSFVPRNKFTT